MPRADRIMLHYYGNHWGHERACVGLLAWASGPERLVKYRAATDPSRIQAFFRLEEKHARNILEQVGFMLQTAAASWFVRPINVTTELLSAGANLRADEPLPFVYDTPDDFNRLFEMLFERGVECRMPPQARP